MPKKRRHYRVKPGHTDLIKASVPSNACNLPGTIEDLSACGIKLSFEDPDDPRLSLRAIIELKLSSPYLEQYLAVPSIVTYRARTDQGTSYGFEFIDWLGLLHMVPEELKAVFNRRRDHRVTPDPRAPIRLVLEVAGSRLEATVPVEDISTSGLSFVAGPDLEKALGDAEDIGLSFRLPGTGEDIPFQGKIIMRCLTRDGVRHGVYLLEEATEAHKQGVKALASYVVGRRRETLGLPPAPADLVVSTGSWPSWQVR